MTQDNILDETIRLPFEAKANGYFNGDMFEDWYRTKPTNLKELRFWDFLHNWEQGILLSANETLYELVIKSIKELNDER